MKAVIAAAALAICGATGGCADAPQRTAATAQDEDAGRLAAPPARPSRAPWKPGLRRLTPEGTEGGLLLVPRGLRPGRAVPLVISLHGAGNRATSGVRPFRAEAARRRVLLLAPESRGAIWDRTTGDFGVDVRTINALVAEVGARHRIGRIGLVGFSNGASYALSLGLRNGDRVRRIAALAPGTVDPGRRRGRPRVLVAHGRRDGVLPVARSRELVRRLRGSGLRVTYREFSGGHEVRPEIAALALRHLTR